jgi:hypothetical protein
MEQASKKRGYKTITKPTSNIKLFVGFVFRLVYTFLTSVEAILGYSLDFYFSKGDL